MRNWINWRHLAGYALACGAAAAHATDAAFPTETIFEAEAASYQAPWFLQSSGTAAGAGYLAAQGPAVPQLPAASAPAELSYAIAVDHASSYKIWLRVYAPDEAANSLYAAVDDGPYVNFGPAASPNWQWISTGEFKLSAGTHQLKIKYREARTGIDRLLVTAQSYFVPSGLGTNPGFPVAMPAPNQPAPPSSAMPPHEHPRLFVRRPDVAQLIRFKDDALGGAHSGNPEYERLKQAWTAMSAAAAANTDGELPARGSGTDAVYCAGVASTIQAKALGYLLDPSNVVSGQHAIKLMSAYLDKDICQASSDTRVIGESITLSAIVYDWCYPLMGTQAKQLFVQRFMERAPQMEIGFPTVKQGSISGHGAEAQLMRDQMSAAIAFYDEEPALYNLIGGRFFATYVNVRDYAYGSGAHHQGDSYGPYRYTWDMFAAWIMRRMGAGDVFSAQQQTVPYQWLYMRRPDGQLMRDGDTYQSQYMQQGKYWYEPRAYMLPASFYNDPLIKYEFAAKQLPNMGAADDIWLILMNNPELAPAPAAAQGELPLSRYFADPAGLMIARTGWTNSTQPQYGADVAIATMKVGATNFGGHQHQDAGHFELYYKGALAIDSGIYQGANQGVEQGYGSAHDLNYHKRTIAHNAMLVYTPGETFNESFAAIVSNDGGQRFVGPEPANKDVLLNPSKSYAVAASTRHQVGPDSARPDYSYLKGDLAKAYTAKISAYTRSFVFLNLKNSAHPAALLVLDKVSSSDPNYKKTWLLHSVQEPSIDGDTVTIERTVANQYNGKLVNRTVLPAGAQIAKVGGSGMEFTVPNAQGGLDNYPIAPLYPTSNTEEAGAWRVEVVPATPAASDLFLNAMQVLDAGTQSIPLATEAIASELMAGVKIADRAVLFAKGADIAAGASFVLAPAGAPLRVLVTDLAPGFWRVSIDGAAATVEYEVKAGEGTLYFLAQSGGNVALTRADARTLPEPAPLPSL
ncbi:MAG: heparin/heparin-sulfate lyase HepB [Pseudomonadota bacterium]